MAVTPGLGVTELVDNADGNESVVNEGFRRLEVFAGREVLDRNLTAPPGGESDGDTYIIASTATGDWATHDNDVTWYQSGEWKFFTPYEGIELWVADEDTRVIWDGSAWVAPDTYSTAETWTGRRWTDGKKVYRKVVSTGSLPNSTFDTNAHGITGLATVVRLHGIATNGSLHLPLPFVYAAGGSFIQLLANGTNITITTQDGTWITYSGTAIIEYTKS